MLRGLDLGLQSLFKEAGKVGFFFFFFPKGPRVGYSMVRKQIQPPFESIWANPRGNRVSQ